jgi:hypothetical protein
MTKRNKKITHAGHKFGTNLAYGKFSEVATEFQTLRLSPPDVKCRPGKRTGEILRFVRGLRLSARVIYILRDQLSGSNLEVSWGHLLDKNKASCSPECDIIIHEKGHVKKWNGDGGNNPIMDFRFIEAEKARAVVSCKSLLTDVDHDYPKDLKRYGVKRVFLFAESCQTEHFKKLNFKAKKAGYTALGCLYFTSSKGEGFKTDETLHANFAEAIGKVCC